MMTEENVIEWPFTDGNVVESYEAITDHSERMEVITALAVLAYKDIGGAL